MVVIAENHNPIRWSNNQLLDFDISDSGTLGESTGESASAVDTDNSTTPWSGVASATL